MGPRSASVDFGWSRLSCAVSRNSFPERTWSDQRRTKRTPNAARTRNPRIPSRKRSCGVTRYGASTRGSRGRKRPGRIGTGRLANELHLGRAPGRLEHPLAEGANREGEEEVERDCRRQLVDEDHLRRGGLAKEEVHDERAERVEHGHDCDRDHRRMRAVAARRLAVASDPEPGEREQERREAEGAEAGDVDQEACPEATDGAEDRALRERDGDERDEDEVG